MGFLDQVTETFNAVKDGATTKAKEVSTTVSLKNQIHTEEKKLTELYVRLGKAYFDKFQEDDSDEKAADMITIKAVKEAIKTLNEQLAQVKGVRICEECGEEIDLDAIFCPKCGAKKEADE